MKTNLQHNVTVDQPIEKVWAVLSDPWQVAPCLPGAEITEAVSDTEFKGRVKVKLGPLSMSMKGTITETATRDRKNIICTGGMSLPRCLTMAPIPVRRNAAMRIQNAPRRLAGSSSQ